MHCVKCGRKTEGEQVFCQLCLEDADKYPVKPGTPIQLPHRAPELPVKKKPGKEKPELKPEERIARLRRRVRWLTLGGKWGSCAVLVYLALGAVGLPVFSGFRGGIGTLLGPTGGYLFGFMLTSLLYWLVSAVLPGKVGRLLGLILGQAGSLVLGWLWLRQFTAVAFFPATLPFLLPALFKLALAWLISRRLRRSFPS